MGKKSKKFKVVYIQTIETEVEFEYPIEDIEAAYVFLDGDGYQHLDDGTVVDEELVEIEAID